MESGVMKVVLSSIFNGSHRELPAAEAICGRRETAEKTEKNYKPVLLFTGKDQAEDDYQEKTSREVFASLVNASNCANFHMDSEHDRYLTFASAGSFLRKYR
jgi:hypothetical protein